MADGERFPGFDVLSQQSTWDPVTTGIVLRRLAPPAPARYFTSSEEAAGRALLDRLLALEPSQDIPVFAMVDDRLAEGDTDGWHYDDMPPDGEAWKASLGNIDRDARDQHGAQFCELTAAAQKQILEDVRTGTDWYGLPARRVWNLWLRYACAAYYSHPHAWNEIGFGGPAYPRGYANLGLGKREHWEVADTDGRDPVPWASRVERSRRRHESAP